MRFGLKLKTIIITRFKDQEKEISTLNWKLNEDHNKKG